MTFKLPVPEWYQLNNQGCITTYEHIQQDFGGDIGTKPFYTEAQLKQAVRDVLEQAAQECEKIAINDIPHTDSYVARICVKELRKLK